MHTYCYIRASLQNLSGLYAATSAVMMLGTEIRIHENLGSRVTSALLAYLQSTWTRMNKIDSSQETTCGPLADEMIRCKSTWLYEIVSDVVVTDVMVLLLRVQRRFIDLAVLLEGDVLGRSSINS